MRRIVMHVGAEVAAAYERAAKKRGVPVEAMINEFIGEKLRDFVKETGANLPVAATENAWGRAGLTMQQRSEIILNDAIASVFDAVAKSKGVETNLFISEFFSEKLKELITEGGGESFSLVQEEGVRYVTAAAGQDPKKKPDAPS